MAQEGMEHWRRAVRWTCAGIFVAALVGGLLGQLTAGGTALTDGRVRSGQATTSTTCEFLGELGELGGIGDPDHGSWRRGGGEDGGQGIGRPPLAARPALGVDRRGHAGRAHRVTPWSTALARCAGVPARVAALAPTKVNSPDFTSADQVDAVEDSVSVYASAAQARAEYAALASSKTTGCMNRVASAPLQRNMQKEAGSTTTVGVVSFTDLPAAAAALHLTGFTVTIPIAAGARAHGPEHAGGLRLRCPAAPDDVQRQRLGLPARARRGVALHGQGGPLGAQRALVRRGPFGTLPGDRRDPEGCPMAPTKPQSDPDRWWHGGVFYQIYPRSYADSNGDGVGDLPGILSKLDYLAGLGITGIWLSPVTCSPNRDWGYDVSDYRAIDPSFGTIDDLDALVREADRRGIRILMDLVPNHTSDQHPWFVDALRGRDSAHRDYYVWADPKPDDSLPNNWSSIFGGPAWQYDEASGQYFLHNFEAAQPDLNWWNEEVRREFDDIVRFWWDRGVAGFRIDVCNMMIKDKLLRDNPPATEDDPLDQQFMGLRAVYNTDRPEAHEILQRWRAIADTYEPPRLLMGETNVDKLPVLVDFYGDGHNELHGGFNFVFINAPLEAAPCARWWRRPRRSSPTAPGPFGRRRTTTCRASPPAGPPATRPRSNWLCCSCSRCAARPSSTRATRSAWSTAPLHARTSSTLVGRALLARLQRPRRRAHADAVERRTRRRLHGGGRAPVAAHGRPGAVQRRRPGGRPPLGARALPSCHRSPPGQRGPGRRRLPVAPLARRDVGLCAGDGDGGARCSSTCRARRSRSRVSSAWWP